MKYIYYIKSKVGKSSNGKKIRIPVLTEDNSNHQHISSRWRFRSFYYTKLLLIDLGTYSVLLCKSLSANTKITSHRPIKKTTGTVLTLASIRGMCSFRQSPIFHLHKLGTKELSNTTDNSRPKIEKNRTIF